MGNIGGTGRRGEGKISILLQSEGPVKKEDGWEEKASQHSLKTVGYLIRSEQALLLVKEDLSAILVLLHFYLAWIEEWWEYF